MVGLSSAEASVLASEIAAKGLSVRQTEQRVRENRIRSERGTSERSKTSGGKRSPALRQLEDQLRHYLQTDVHVELNGDAKGSLRIAFYSEDDLDRLVSLVLREKRSELE